MKKVAKIDKIEDQDDNLIYYIHSMAIHNFTIS